MANNEENLPLVHNVNQQEGAWNGNIIDWLIDHTSLHQWLIPVLLVSSK